MPESPLPTLLTDVIRRLKENPHLITGHKWDHPKTLDVSGVNAAAKSLGIGPIFEIGEVPPWRNWERRLLNRIKWGLPVDHPINEDGVELVTPIRVEQLLAFAPFSDVPPIRVQRCLGVTRVAGDTLESINEAIISRLEPWVREVQNHLGQT